MANNYVQRGDVIDYSNTGSAISAGDVVVILAGSSGKIGVAIDDIAATTGTGAVQVEGVFELAAETGVVWNPGDALYWSGTVLTKTVGSNEPAGYAFEAKASGTALGKTKLPG